MTNFSISEFIDTAITKGDTETYSFEIGDGLSINFCAKLQTCCWDTKTWHTAPTFWISRAYRHELEVTASTREEFEEAANCGKPMVTLISFHSYDNACREAGDLAINMGIKEYQYSSGRGEEFGIRFQAVSRCYLMPVIVAEETTLYLYDKYKIAEDAMLEGWTGYDHVVFKDEGWGMYNHQAWARKTHWDTTGKKYEHLLGQVFSGTPAYRDTKKRLWTNTHLAYCPFRPTKPNAMLWDTTGYGRLVIDNVMNTQTYNSTCWEQDRYGGSRFPADVEFAE